MNATLARKNRFAGKCGTCDQTVAAETGRIEKIDGRWATFHFDGQCPAPVAAPAPSGLDLSDLPSGKYAVPGGDTRLKVLVQNVEKGKWAGWVFVKDAAVYGNGRRYGSQKPGAEYRGDIADALAAIIADPHAAMAAYGHLTGTCGRCGLHLEDETSVARGIGPVCIKKLGW